MHSNNYQIGAILCAILLFFTIQSPAQVFINELLAINASLQEDPDFGKKSDWIELYNSSNSEIDLSDWFLSDNLSDSTKWQVPSGTIIPPNSYLLFWADNENIGNHTNFKLSKDGETIALFNPSGNLVDAIEFGIQSTDISYGRLIDGSEERGFFNEPTPEMPNGSGYDGVVFYEAQFEPKGGFYDNPFNLELTSIEGEIRYTLDGSVPNENSELFSSPIPIFETVVVRAKIFQANRIPGKTITHSYFFEENLEERKLPIVSISTHPDNFWGVDTGIYMQDFKPLWEHPINIELFENDGNNRAAFNELAGIKINGNHSWQLPQKMMGIYFKNDYDKKNLEYPLFFERDRNLFDNFSFRASGTDQAYTFFRDALIQRITESNMNLETQGYKPASIFVNGEHLGLFNMRSRLDEQYIEHYFGLEEGEYDIIDNNGVVEEGDTLAFHELFELIHQDLTVQSNFDALSAMIDLDNLTDYFITEIWSSNGSWGHNIKWWRPKSPDAKWRFLLKDTDRGMFSPTSNSFGNFTLEGISPTDYEWARAILRQLFENDDFKNQFVKQFADHLFTTFHPETIRPQIAEMRANIEHEIPYQIDRWLGAESNLGDAIPNIQHWEDQVSRLNFFSEFRSTHIWKELQNFFATPPASTLSLLTYPANSGQIKLNNLSIPQDQWSSLYLDDTPFILNAKADIGQQFEGWSIGTFERVVPRQAQWKYMDDGSDLGETWRTESFNDSNWNSGQAQLGYGDFDETTLLDYGADENDKYITTYFRKKFIVEDLTDFTGQIIINLLVDDGAVFYLNGEEIRRVNMPVGEITTNSLAIRGINTIQEFDYNQLIINTNLLKEGENTLAVEVHQEDPTSSDISFDMDFILVKRAGNQFFSNNESILFTLSQDTVLIANFAPTGICTLPETISSNMVLTTDCSPYYAIGTTTVLPNVSLQIEAGVNILMPDEASLIIKGDLQVNGTEDSPVKLLPSPDNFNPNWGNLHFEHSSALSNLDYLEIDGATKGAHPLRENAAISVYYGDLSIQNLKIENVSGQFLQGQYGSIDLQNSNLSSQNGDKMLHFKHGIATIENCEFIGAETAETTAIQLEQMTGAIIRQNRIQQLLAKDSKGISISDASEGIILEKNFFHNCRDKGVLVKEKSNAMIQHNTFVNCKHAIGLQSEANAIINQNTFYNNEIAVKAFEKEIGKGGGNALISNSILSNSSENAISADELSNLQVNFSISDTDTLTNNLFGNPHFFNPTNNDFQLLAISPCFSSGQNGSDLGTNFHQFTAPAEILISAIHYHPPFDAEAEFIDIYNPSPTPLNLAGYEITAGIEFIFPEGFVLLPFEKVRLVKNLDFFPDATETLLEWGNGKLDNGGETITIQNVHGIVIDQVIYDDVAPWSESADGLGKYLSLKDSDLDNHFGENWEAIGDLTDLTTEPKNQPFIQIKPNPVSGDFLTISTDFPMKEIVIYDVLGKMINRVQVESKFEEMLSVWGFENGIYFLEIDEKIVEKIMILGDR